MRISSAIVCGWVLLASPLAAMAEDVSVYIPNFSFESPAITDGTSTDNSIPEWTAGANGGNFLSLAYGVRNPTTDDVIPTHGEQIGYLDSSRVNGGVGPVVYTSDLASSTAAGQAFTISVDLGAQYSATLVQLTLFVNGQYNNQFSNYQGLTKVLVNRTYTYTSTAAGEHISIGIFAGIGNNASTQSGEVYFDNVRLTGPAGIEVPEPGMLAMATVAASLGLLRRRRIAV